MTKEKKQHEDGVPALFQISQKAIIYDSATKRFLLVKFDEVENKAARGRWGFVGGRINEGETAKQAIEREIIEETGNIEFEVGEIIDIHIDDRCRIGYLVFYKGGEIKLSNEHSEYSWKTSGEINEEKNCHPGLRQFVNSAVTAIQSEEYLSDLKRLQADFENYKKRMANEQRDTMRFITTGIISDLVPILDNFNMAVAHVPEDKKSDPWVTGITYIERQFEEVIAGYGVDIMEVKVGDTFDPTRHEAVGSEAKNEESGIENQDETKEKEQKIAKVLQKGYLMGDKVIRAAKVTVS
jgi:molecular chaperone GrpE